MALLDHKASDTAHLKAGHNTTRGNWNDFYVIPGCSGRWQRLVAGGACQSGPSVNRALDVMAVSYRRKRATGEWRQEMMG